MQKTKVIDNNGFNPVFNEVFHFDIHNSDIANLTFVVLDSSLLEQTEFIAYSPCLSTALDQDSEQYLLDKNGMRDGDFEFMTLFVS